MQRALRYGTVSPRATSSTTPGPVAGTRAASSCSSCGRSVATSGGAARAGRATAMSNSSVASQALMVVRRVLMGVALTVLLTARLTVRLTARLTGVLTLGLTVVLTVARWAGETAGMRAPVGREDGQRHTNLATPASRLRPAARQPDRPLRSSSATTSGIAAKAALRLPLRLQLRR